MRLDARGLRRVVKMGAREQAILDMRKTPLAFIPGEFIALVGGSGSGKSTLIKALNGLAPAQEGQILIDGHPIIAGGNARPFSALYAIVGYVPQDDIMHQELTVDELLQSVAHLRLADLTDVEISLTIDDTLDAVDLKEHSHKRISQLSGGQRKRVNIAMELLAQPRLLFLDEPTSGLDPGLDLEVMGLLRQWARGETENGRSKDPKTIVLVTHATENIELCDYIAFLEPGGRLAYFGPPQEAKTFFFPERNPEQVAYSQLYRRVTEGPTRIDEDDETSWADRYLESPLYQKYVVERTRRLISQMEDHSLTLPESQSKILPKSTEPFKYRIQAALRQITILAKRLLTRTLRDRFNTIFMLLQPLFVAWLLSGVASEQALSPGRDAVDAQKVLFVLACAVVWLGVINATKAIVSEKDIYQRERRYGLGAAPYVLSKALVLGGIGVIQVFLLLIAINWVLELPHEGVFLPIVFEYGVTLSLSLIAGLSLGLLISSLAHSSDMATTLMFVVLIVQVIFSGLLFDPQGLAELPAALTISRWSLRALGSSSDLNRLLSSAVSVGYTWNADYKAEVGYLMQIWLVLLTYALICITLTSWRESHQH
jgi:ABC-type multidrug transport system ATPase subunit